MRSAPEYGRTLTGLSLNLIVRDVARSLPFYTEVLGFRAAIRADGYVALEQGAMRIQLHEDRTYAKMPWAGALASGAKRGLGCEIRILGLDPHAVEAAARTHGAVLLPTSDRSGHGWRDCVIADPDGYTFAVGTALP